MRKELTRLLYTGFWLHYGKHGEMSKEKYMCCFLGAPVETKDAIVKGEMYSQDVVMCVKYSDTDLELQHLGGRNRKSMSIGSSSATQGVQGQPEFCLKTKLSMKL